MFLTPDDLAPFAVIDAAKAAAMVEDVEAQAVLAAPCIGEPDFLEDEVGVAAVRSILRGAVLRWNDAGSGTVYQQTSGPFSQMQQPAARKGMFWPDELDQLRGLCGSRSGAFSVDLLAWPDETTP